MPTLMILMIFIWLLVIVIMNTMLQVRPSILYQSSLWAVAVPAALVAVAVAV